MKFQVPGAPGRTGRRIVSIRQSAVADAMPDRAGFGRHFREAPAISGRPG